MQRFINRIDNSKSFISPLFLFLAIWLAINMIQAYFTELAHDEAYYWMYSRFLAWGYFDHPPMIALVIKAGYMVIKNELGVRLFICIMSTGTLYLLYKLIDHPDKKLSFFIILTLSIGMVSTHVCGWIAIPDTPLILFVGLFFYLYRLYLDDDNIILAVFIAVVIALMLYSKYHGLLVVLFTLISNLSLFKRKSFWVILVLAAVFMIPHLFWQINNHFPTFDYHLIGRSSHYKIDYTINYILGQLVTAGPLAAPIVIFFAFKYKCANLFDKALKYNLAGTFIFFFISTFRGPVEPHWTAIAYIPLIILSYKGIIDNKKVKRWMHYLFWPSIIFAFFIRTALVYDFFPKSWILLNEFHGWDKWAKELQESAKGRKVVFTNKYQFPSKYTFYTGEFSHTLNNVNYRKNQYDIWNFEDSIQDKPVMLIQGEKSADSLITGNGLIHRYQFIDNFKSYFRVKITIIKDRDIFQHNSEASFIIMVENNTENAIKFGKNRNWTSFLCYAYSKKGEYIFPPIIIHNAELVSMEPHSCYLQKIKINTPASPGIYKLHIWIKTGNLAPSNNSTPVKIKVI